MRFQDNNLHHIPVQEDAVSDNCLRNKGFPSYLSTQFLGAFNDNFIQTLLAFFLIKTASDIAVSASYTTLLKVFFFLPFVLFSAYAGYLSDRFAKKQVMIGVKIAEVLIVLLAIQGLIGHNLVVVYMTVFLLGIHSAFFSPAKYAILPEIVSHRELSRANGYLETTTFLAIIMGTGLSGAVLSIDSTGYVIPSVIMVITTILGIISALYIPHSEARAPQMRPSYNPLISVKVLGEIKQNRNLFLVVLGISFFWFLAALFNTNIMLYSRELADWSEKQTSILLAALGVGIGMGGLFAGKVSEGKVELGLVPIGALGTSLACCALAMSYTSYTLTLCLLLFLGFSGGLFCVPLNAYLQENSPANKRGSYVAANNFLNFVFMSSSALIVYLVISQLHLTPAHVFSIMGIITLIVTAYSCYLMPEMVIRSVNWVFANLIYRLHIVGAKNIPTEGGALLVCNHVSYADACLLLAATERPIRFMMYEPIYNFPLIKPFAKIARAIPISSTAGPKRMLQAFNTARDLMLQGEIVCIFAEGSLTRVGNLLPFNRGLEKIVRNTDIPIIPVHLDQIWGSIFSFFEGKFFWKLPRAIPYHVTISFGAPLPSHSPTYAVRQAVWELSANAFNYRRKCYQLLHAAFLQVGKANPFRACITDTTGVKLNYLTTVVGSLIMRDIFTKALENISPPTATSTKLRLYGDLKSSDYGVMSKHTSIGIFMPPSVGAALGNIGALFAKCIPINLNYTTGEQSLASACRQAKVQCIFTSRRFIEKLPPPQGIKLLFIEDIQKQITWQQKLYYSLLVLLLPTRLLERLLIADTSQADDLATIIFSSGSTGEPKGVMLSHRNISTNIQALYDVFQLSRKDCFLGTLPFFHSFGFTGTLWLPLLGGVKAAYHYNPLEAEVIGRIVKKEGCTLLLSTPTFLTHYLRKCSKEQFASLRFVIVGAEKLKASLAEKFRDKFGIMPLEGYGCTELSPVASLNLPDVEHANLVQRGYKPYTVGQPLPGIAAKVVHPNSIPELPVFAPALKGEQGSTSEAAEAIEGEMKEEQITVGQLPGLPPNTEGLLLIKGENVMMGYLNNPEKTRESIRDGWYITGDIALIDDDGFITIVDRLSRFSKIGGEMIPHVVIEQEITSYVENMARDNLGEDNLAVAPHGATVVKEVMTEERTIAVTGIPDEAKGERLIVIHTTKLDPGSVVKYLAEKKFPNLWIPRTDCFFLVDTLPILGTGKLDLQGVKQLALTLSSPSK